MAEIKNSFLRSKMNKDLDDRLVPNGEYRDAYNISVGKSEEDDIGALENVLGNNLEVNFPVGTSVIGYYSDKANSIIYVFLTDQQNKDVNVYVPDNAYCSIVSWNGSTLNTLVSGSFLNFTPNFPITGVNLIENLLFFTDNRNQPRKINVTTATSNSGYYTKETDISVAKYNPYEEISLLKTTTSVVKTLDGTSPTTIFSVDVNSNIEVGMTVISVSSASADKINGADYITVVSAVTSGVSPNEITTVTLSSAPSNSSDNLAIGDKMTFLISTMTNESDVATWPGDPNYLESRYVRFSYRLVYDDGENSLMAPFTQIAFIPKQKGFFINGDEDAAYRSTVLEFFENNVNNIKLIIPLPDKALNCQPTTAANYKIKEIEVLYKESDQNVVKVLDSINYLQWETSSLNYYEYNYQSRKPYRTLSPTQTVRVYDKVPTRALAQESVGNRIIYGNFKDKYTPPSHLNYRIAVGDKQDSVGFDNWIEYPNHSLKQNRNYQVGFVLVDKFGRQSSVILSNVDESTGTSSTGDISKGSTIYNPYNGSINDIEIYTWFGNALQAVVEGAITSGSNNLPNTTFAEPGLYAVPKGGVSIGFDINGVNAIVAGNLYTFTLSATAVVANAPAVGDYMRGEYVDYVEVTDVQTPGVNPLEYVVTTDNPINIDLYSNSPNVSVDPKFAYSINPRGWYSYKVVVKQNEQDYYNAYLPGILDGYPQQPGISTATTNDNLASSIGGSTSLQLATANANIQQGMRVSGTGILGVPVIASVIDVQTYTFSTTQYLGANANLSYTTWESGVFPGNENGETANVVLINDNINKIPRDLSEVGPDQKQYRSSVQLFGRVENTATGNKQYFPGTLTDTVVSISSADDSNMDLETLSDTGVGNLYQLDTNPLIARVSTKNPIGVTTASMVPYLAIYETEPVDSVLDIYWETSTVGLISDLNADVANGFDGPSQLSNVVVTYNESLVSGNAITNQFQVQNASGADLNFPSNGFVLDSVNTAGQAGDFTLVRVSQNPDTFEVRLTGNPIFDYKSLTALTPPSLQNNEYIITLTFTLATGESGSFSINANLGNIAPTLTNATGAVGSKTLPNVSVAQETTGVITTTELAAENGAGSLIANDRLVNLKYSKVSEVDSAGNATTEFTMSVSGANNVGQISKTSANTPLGVYTLGITVEDAYDITLPALGTGSLSTDTANNNTPITLQITVGPEPVNSGVYSGCIDNSTAIRSANTAYPLGVANSTPSDIDACWYISNNTLSASDLPAPWNNSTRKATQNGGSAFHLGNTTVTSTNPTGIKQQLNQGSIVFTLNLYQDYNTSQPLSLALTAGVDGWNIYHRSGSSDPNGWQLAVDINDVNQNGFLNTMLTSIGSVGSFAYNQMVFAFNTPGEYAIIATGITTNGEFTTVNNDGMPMAWVNADDLNFAQCVIVPDESGTNYASTTTPKSYSYTAHNPQSGYNCSGSGSTTVWSTTPYGEYVSQFYTQAGLTSVWQPSSYDVNQAYYSYNVSQFNTTPSPITITPYSGYTFSGKISSIGGVVDLSGSCNIQNCGTFGSSSSCAPLIRSN